MAYVEEEFSRAPSQAPPDSFLFSASDILIPPHTSRQHSPEGEFTLETENCLVEEEIPIYWFAGDLRKYNFFIYKKKYSRDWGYKSIVEFLRCQQCEEVASWLLEALFNNKKV
jgi:hypothetical protein